MKTEILKLRELMEDRGINCYIVTTGDFHGSEYIHDFFKTRAFISGFTGSAGTLLVTPEDALLWTDSRYHIQAKDQLAGSGIDLMKMGLEGVPSLEEYLEGVLEPGMTMGFDGAILPGVQGERWEALAESLSVSLIFDPDLVGEIWEERPSLSGSEIWALPESSTGESFFSKLSGVRDAMEEKGASHYLVADLMENAYLYNLRGSDVEHTPVFFSYSLITRDEETLYIFDGAIPREREDELLPRGVKRADYFRIAQDLEALPSGSKILLDPESVSYSLIKSIPEGCEIISSTSPLTEMKAVKNPVEIAATKRAHIDDGVAMAEFLCWIKGKASEAQAAGKKETGESEVSAGEYLDGLRLKGENCFDLSFGTIAGYGEHAAINHYSATPETDLPIMAEGYLLVDSGGQYYTGTTDITRTMAMGPLTEEMKRAYTGVLKGHIALATCRVPENTPGKVLDELTRAPLAEYGLSFGHGTGHGVGHVLSVHEGPQSISYRAAGEIPFKPCMVVSNEPGYYPEGEYGIRIENLILCCQDRKTSELYFENLTLCPYEREAIIKEELSPAELEYVDNYHAWVYETLAPLVSPETREWLEDACAPL